MQATTIHSYVFVDTNRAPNHDRATDTDRSPRQTGQSRLSKHIFPLILMVDGSQYMSASCALLLFTQLQVIGQLFIRRIRMSG